MADMRNTFDKATLANLASTELKFVASICAPLSWIEENAEGRKKMLNGTAFFINTGTRIFAITANHVIEEWKKGTSALQLSDLQIDFDNKNKLIDTDDNIDLATFEIEESDIKSIGKTIFEGPTSKWPPDSPQSSEGLCYAGFPETETIGPDNREVYFGAVSGGGIVSSINDRDISIQLERDKLIPVLGAGIPPENFNFSGMSGGPVLAHTCSDNGLLGWSLAGTIYQGPNTSSVSGKAINGLEIIWARRAHFILPNGQLNRSLWKN